MANRRMAARRTGTDRYWLSNLPATTAKRTLVRLAKLRRRIEHDHREIKTGLGLDHYEGRTWQGWHHHTTLVSAVDGHWPMLAVSLPRGATLIGPHSVCWGRVGSHGRIHSASGQTAP